MVAPTSPEPGGRSAPPPPPPPPAREGPTSTHGSRYVSRPRRRWWLVGLLVAAALVLGGVSMLVVWTAEPERSTTRVIDDHPGVTSVLLDLDDVDVEVVSGGTDVEVDATVRRVGTNVEPTSEVVDGVLTLRLDCPGGPWWLFGQRCGGDYRIRVPAGTSLGGTTSNGRLALAGLDGDVDLATSNGRVSLTALTGNARVRSSNGRVTGTDLQGDVLVVASSNGAVQLDLAEAPTSLVVDTSNGAIEVGVPADGEAWRVEAETSNGSVDLDVPLDDDAGRSMDLRTSNGAIAVSSG